MRVLEMGAHMIGLIFVVLFGITVFLLLLAINFIKLISKIADAVNDRVRTKR